MLTYLASATWPELKSQSSHYLPLTVFKRHERLVVVKMEKSLEDGNDRVLSPSELQTAIDARADSEFHQAKTAYAQERERLILQLKTAETPELKEETISLLDKCERDFSRLFHDVRSGRYRDAIAARERSINEARQAMVAAATLTQTKKKQVSGTQNPPKPRKSQKHPSKKSKANKATKKGQRLVRSDTARQRTNPHRSQSTTLNGVVTATAQEVENFIRAGSRVVYAFKNRADCIECGKPIPLSTDGSGWVPHTGPEGMLCRPATEKVIFVDNQLKKPDRPKHRIKVPITSGYAKCIKCKQNVKVLSNRRWIEHPDKMRQICRPDYSLVDFYYVQSDSYVSPQKIEKKKTKSTSRVNPRDTFAEATAALRDMSAGKKPGTGKGRTWRGGGKQAAPVRITRILLAGSPGLGRR